MINLKATLYRLRKMKGVSHTTFNPKGPGVVRIHLIPPKFSLKGDVPSVAIINGQDIIPVNYSWAILLDAFIQEVNRYSGEEIRGYEMRLIRREVINQVRRIYPRTSSITLNEDLDKIITTLCDIAYGREPSVEIEYMTLGEYAPYMTAPHRMDLMVSAMTKDGRWNCNNKCIHCYAAGQFEADVHELSTKEWFKILDKCRKANIPQVTFTGGEPTMRKDIVELVDYAQWFVTRLNTNGVNLTPSLCAQLYNASLDSVQITLYSNNREKHNQLVGAPNFNRTVTGIKNALCNGLNVSINTPLCTINRDYVETLKFINSLGVTYVSCSGLICAGNALTVNSKRTQLSENELARIMTEAVNYCNRNHMQISFTSPGWLSEEILQKLKLVVPCCGACLSNMAIAPNGDVVPCQSWLLEDSSLGNILTTPWKNIWESSKCTKIRENSAAMNFKCPLRNLEEV